MLVDEYQDTNRLQATILLGLKPDGRGVTVVGDDAQAIYSFRAAEARNILDFPGCFDPPARVVTLERNYRSTQPILDASNALIAQAAERFTKDLWTDKASSARPQLVTVEDDAAQARWVADRMLEQREDGIALKRQAVLFRTAHHSAATRTRTGAPQHPLRQVRRPQVPRSVAHQGSAVAAALGREPAQPARGLSRRAARRRHRPGVGAPAARHDAGGGRPGRGAAGLQATAGSRHRLGGVRCALCKPAPWRGCWPGELQRVNRWLALQLGRLHDDAALRAADLTQLACIAAGYATRERFLTELTLDPPSATSDEAGVPLLDEDYAILSTIHSAKGQEWHAVYVLNAVDGCMPSDMATGSATEIEEERRLLYVAMTRAREQLHLLVPQRFHVHQQASLGDRHVYATLTRFIPPSVAAHFDAVVPATAGGCGTAVDVAPPAPRIDVAGRIRSMWD